MLRYALLISISALFTIDANRAAGATPFDELMRQVPADTNVLVLIDGERIRRSAFVKQEKLADNEPGAQANHHVVPRSEVNVLVLAARIRGFRSSMTDSETALLGLTSAPSLSGLAATYGGTFEKLGKIDYVTLPTGAMALVGGPQTLAVLTPPDRQRALRFLNSAKTSKAGSLSPFLEDVYKTHAPQADALIALDMEELFPKSQIMHYLNDTRLLHDRASDALTTTKLLSSIRGLVLRLKFRDTVTGELRIEFHEPVEGVSPWARELFEEMLDDAGAAVDDFADWSFDHDERSLVFEGKLSPRGLRQLFSLINFPTEVPPENAPNAKLTPEQEQRRTAQASLDRFRATQKLLDDLRSPVNTRNLSTGENGMWFDKYAAKIAALPTLHVDKDLLDYCDDVVMRLRVQSTRFRMVGIKAGQYSQNPNYFWTCFGNFYGTIYTVNKTESDASQVRKMERAGAATDKYQQFEAIDKATVEIRREMTDRYQVQF